MNISKQAVLDVLKNYGLDDLDTGYLTSIINALPSISDGWISVSEYPKDSPVVQRWHKIYKCVVSVYYKPGVSTIENCNWVTGTLDHTWPEEAFEPFFKPLPQPPTK